MIKLSSNFSVKNEVLDQLQEDINIVKACLKGDTKAQAKLYHKYKGVLFGVCLRYANNQQEAEDWLQDGFVKIFQDLHQYRPLFSLITWMRKVVVNTALMHLRSQKKLDLQEIAQHLNGVYTQPDDDYETDGSSTGKMLLGMMQKLPPGYRAIFNLHVIDGYTHKEIAEILGINESTSKSQLSRAKRLLRKLIKEEIFC